MTNEDLNYHGIIYKIYCEDESVDYEYIGSTLNFTQRKRCHKVRCNNTTSTHYNYKVYRTIREHGGWDNWRMTEIEKYLCADKTELRIREEYHRKLSKLSLNSHKCHSGFDNKKDYLKQYYQDNFDHIKAQKQQYNEENKEAIRAHKKQYSDDRKDIKREYDKQYREENKEHLNAQHKKYYEDNKEEILKKDKEYYLKNKEMILKKSSTKITCECGQTLSQGSLNAHMKSTRHLKAMGQVDAQPVKIECECGDLIAHSSMKNHKKTKKHLEAMGQSYEPEIYECDCGVKIILTSRSKNRHNKSKRHLAYLSSIE